MLTLIQWVRVVVPGGVVRAVGSTFRLSIAMTCEAKSSRSRTSIYTVQKGIASGIMKGMKVALNLIETETAQQPKFPRKPWTLSLQMTKQEAK